VTSDEAEDTIAFWLDGLIASLRRHKPDWRPSCFVVDCCEAQINALRCALLQRKTLQGACATPAALLSSSSSTAYAHSLLLAGLGSQTCRCSCATTTCAKRG
jgi:hypothetical protein